MLHDLTPNYAGSLWQGVVSFPAMNEALGLDELSETSKGYLQALAETYGKAHGWETRRQILSIMCGVASYSDIARFISGLTRYRFTISNLHRLELGTGVPSASYPSPKIRVDQRQLDHFLCYITSPHLVQDLPFGQKKSPEAFFWTIDLSTQRYSHHDTPEDSTSVYSILPRDWI